ncbi:pirin family protein [Utexia brackfieldae]|uniref:pirin family protein n=1 Tax=Utexia brackfieldae TaxID=3074108 RepID=UPI00370D1BFC
MIYLRKAEDRGFANHGWLESYHTFSFADYYDPDFMGLSSLRVINEDRVQAGQGFGEHPHKDMEILSYVLSGTIEHKDSMGHTERVKAGEFQIMSAGTGIRHSEYNPQNDQLLHFYQIWIMPDRKNLPPRYESRTFAKKTGKQLILSPDAREGSLKVFQDMQLWNWTLAQGELQEYIIPEQYHHVWIQVVSGEMTVNDIQAKTSDGIAITGKQKITIEASQATELLLFELL